MPGLEDLFDVSDYKKGEKGKKTNKTKESKKADKKNEKKKEMKYPLPVRVRSGHICCNLLSEEYEGKMVSETEIKDRIKKLYPELSNIKFNLIKFSNTCTQTLERRGKSTSLRLFSLDMEESEKEESVEDEELEFAPADEEPENMEETDHEEAYEVEEEFGEEDEVEEDGETDSKETANEKGCWIKLEIHYQELTDEQTVVFPVSVVVGSTIMPFIKDVESVEQVRAGWTQVHPEYAGCLFHYDSKQNMLIPFMRGESEIKGRKYKLPVTVGYFQLAEHYDVHDFGTESVVEAQIREKYAKNHPEFENALFKYNAEEHHLFPVLNFKKEETTDKYSLPMLVRGPGFQMTLEESDFKGKTAVTLQEMRAVVEMVYPEFSKERTEMIYDERGFVIPILKGSRKGIKFSSERVGQNLFFVKGKDGASYRIEQMPYGVFDCCVGGGEVDFHLSAEKIPVEIFEEILSFFRKKPQQEAAVQIFYDVKTRKYELYYPKQKVSRTSVYFERNFILEQEKALVMDAHSHGRLPAFFSSTDDYDEKGTRLFLVIGKVGSDSPECILRAGIAGFYKYLHLSDIFDLEDGFYEN